MCARSCATRANHLLRSTLSVSAPPDAHLDIVSPFAGRRLGNGVDLNSGATITPPRLDEYFGEVVHPFRTKSGDSPWVLWILGVGFNLRRPQPGSHVDIRAGAPCRPESALPIWLRGPFTLSQVRRTPRRRRYHRLPDRDSSLGSL